MYAFDKRSLELDRQSQSASPEGKEGGKHDGKTDTKTSKANEKKAARRSAPEILPPSPIAKCEACRESRATSTLSGTRQRAIASCKQIGEGNAAQLEIWRRRIPSTRDI